MTEIAHKLKEKGFCKRNDIYNAFLRIDRKDFVPREAEIYCYEDVPLSIGYGQTISQPSVVAFMIDKLSPKKGDVVLDIGCGSGWTTALLADIVGENGKVIGIERDLHLKKFGETNIRKYNFIEKGRVEILHGDGYKGLPEKAPYNGILVSAALSSKKFMPSSWKDQLKEEGTIVVPIENSIYRFFKKEGELLEEEFFGFRFVPLVKDNDE